MRAEVWADDDDDEAMRKFTKQDVQDADPNLKEAHHSFELVK